MTENRWLSADDVWSSPVTITKIAIESLLHPFMQNGGPNDRHAWIHAGATDHVGTEALLDDGTTLRLCAVSVDHEAIYEQFSDVPTTDALLLLKATVLNDDRSVGALMIISHHSYRVEDLVRGLMASINHPRQNQRGKIAFLLSNHPVMGSHRQSKIIPSRPISWSGKSGLFKCSNPACPSRGASVVIKLEKEALEPTAMGATIYPCPRCPGDGSANWSLSFQKQVTPKDASELVGMQELIYSVPLLAKRKSLQDGPLSVTATMPMPSIEWQDIWDPYDVPKVPESAVAMNMWSDVERAFREINENSELPRWMSLLLSNNNLKALVERIRQEPTENKTPQLAEALALIYDPRRQASFHNADDQLDSHPYISLTPTRFQTLMQEYGQLDNTGAFLDVGSGIGDKQFLAYALGQFERVVGLEFNKQNMGVASYILQSISEGGTSYPISSSLGDALSFEGYGDFDCIYMYRPFRQPILMGRLIRRIAEQMKPGALSFDGIGRAMCFRKAEDGLEIYIDATVGFRPVQSVEEVLLAFDARDGETDDSESTE